MSWQLASLALLVVVLAGGFAWYERSRPPSRVIALVAALAALAVAGRLVLAPIPNVVATTDIVLVSGYAVGAGPGFAVGALAALVSNFWLGQGPWTPWQMAGWGLVGIGGAALAMATRRRLGRLGLAAACAVAGLAYGALLDLSVMVSYGGEQSLDRYLALAARGLPFNITHAAGNAAIALAAGPALVAMLLRFRARFEVSWAERGEEPIAAPPRPVTAGILALTLLIVPAGFGDHPARAAGGAGVARGWLERAQNGDGGFGTAPGSRSSPDLTGWAILGLEAAGRNPLDLGRPTPIAYLRSRAGQLRSTGDLERTILALDAAGVDPRSFGGRDLVAILRRREGADGSFEGQVNLTAFGVLALNATGTPSAALRGSVAWLQRSRNGDGGWGFRPQASSDPDSTGAALQALAAAGGGRVAVRDGVRYLERSQQRDGGWALAGRGPSNSQSTAWAVQGLLAAGAGPGGVRAGGRDPFEFLAARQAPDGHYRYSAASDQTPVWVTGQALLAASREPFPLEAVPRASGRPSGRATSGGAHGAGGDEAESRDRGGRASTGKRSDGRQEAEGSAARIRSAAAAPDQGIAGSLPTADEQGEDRTAQYVAGGFALLTAGLVGGFFWYRRTLP